MFSKQHKFHGLEERYVLKRQDLLRDTRPLLVRMVAGMGNQVVYLTIMISLMLIPLFVPAMTLLCLLLGGLYTFFRNLAYSRDILPLRLPSTFKKKDYGDRMPDGRNYHKASGVFYLGNERNTQKELWLAFRDVLTHHLMYGSTGAGKTENLVSLSFNALAMGGGLSYIDAKAALKLAFQIYTLARFVGRDHDFRVLNYGVSSKPPREYHPKKITNTNNPLNYGSAESLTQFVAATIKTSSDSGNAIFGQNAQVLVTAAMYAAVEKRDNGDWEFDITRLRELLTLPKMLEVVQDQSLSATTRNAIKQFLTSVGWQEGKSIEKQGKNLNEQFSYARGYFSLFLASLSDTYGHIYKTERGEIDLQDVLRNRRILCVMIPSVEKTLQETENIGQINLSGLKNALTSCLGDKVMGTVEDVLESLPIDLRVPFLSVTDEHAAIQTKGYELFLTQGRGFGVGALIGTQDRAGLYKADEHCAQQIEANAKTKSLGALDDPKQTFELARELAGKSHVMQTSGSIVGQNRATSISYQDQLQTQVAQASRVDIRDLQEQVEGEFHLFFRGKIVRARSFFANPPLKKHQQLRINDMLPVPKPPKDSISLKLEKTKKGAQALAQLINAKKRNLIDHQMFLPTKKAKEVFDSPGGLPKNDVAICAFKHWVKCEDLVVDAFNGNLKDNEKTTCFCKQEITKEDPFEIYGYPKFIPDS